jgi:hypothetical protein
MKTAAELKNKETKNVENVEPSTSSPQLVTVGMNNQNENINNNNDNNQNADKILENLAIELTNENDDGPTKNSLNINDNCSNVIKENDINDKETISDKNDNIKNNDLQDIKSNLDSDNKEFNTVMTCNELTANNQTLIKSESASSLTEKVIEKLESCEKKRTKRKTNSFKNTASPLANNPTSKYVSTRENNRKHCQSVKKNFSLWIGVTSCVWGILLYLLKNYGSN